MGDALLPVEEVRVVRAELGVRVGPRVAGEDEVGELRGRRLQVLDGDHL